MATKWRKALSNYFVDEVFLGKTENSFDLFVAERRWLNERNVIEKNIKTINALNSSIVNRKIKLKTLHPTLWTKIANKIQHQTPIYTICQNVAMRLNHVSLYDRFKINPINNNNIWEMNLMHVWMTCDDLDIFSTSVTICNYWSPYILLEISNFRKWNQIKPKWRKEQIIVDKREKLCTNINQINNNNNSFGNSVGFLVLAQEWFISIINCCRCAMLILGQIGWYAFALSNTTDSTMDKTQNSCIAKGETYNPKTMNNEQMPKELQFRITHMCEQIKPTHSFNLFICV